METKANEGGKDDSTEMRVGDELSLTSDGVTGAPARVNGTAHVSRSDLCTPVSDSGNGDAVPKAPVHIETENNNTTYIYCSTPDEKLFTITTEIDIMAILLLLVGMMTRMWKLGEPNGIVFDELHYGKYASLYMKRTFFFDCHPPLGKQLVALAGYLAGYNGNHQFEKIGAGYPSSVPVWALRLVPCLCGSFLIPTVYQVVKAMGLQPWTGVLAALFIALDNALLTQSRFILMESQLLFFAMFGLLCLLKFRKLQHRPFTFYWWFWLLMMAVSLTCAICVKYIGFCTACLAIGILSRDYWKMISDKRMSNKHLLLQLLARISALVVLPLLLYLLTFYVHLSLLTRAGPHDNIMTSAFQASLEGGLASITRGQPLQVSHGSQITLRHTHGRACWLHSHPHVYPIRYADKRGSSHQQQVTCYSFKDVNNWWIVKRPHRNDLVVSEPIDTIKHGDIIQLVHGITSRALNSHDVAAPSSPQNQEVSCYIDYNVSMPAQNLWRVDIVNRDTEGDIWHTIQSQVRLVHVNSTQALKFSGKQLPDWGFHQHEVVTDRVINQEHTVWNVEEHRYTKSSDQKDRERELGLAEFVPTAPTHLSFWEKLWELQIKMFLVNQENVQNHIYSSDPLEWPLMDRGIAYWVSTDSNAQIHLVGNLLLWYSGTGFLVVYVGILLFYMMRRRRGCYDIPIVMWSKYTMIGEILLAGYLLHYIPFFFADRTLFLHHYLPALMFKLMLSAAVIEHVHYIVCFVFRSPLFIGLFRGALFMWVCSAIAVFRCFLPLCYGSGPMSSSDVQTLRWKDSWDLIVHKQ